MSPTPELTMGDMLPGFGGEALQREFDKSNMKANDLLAQIIQGMAFYEESPDEESPEDPELFVLLREQARVNHPPSPAVQASDERNGYHVCTYKLSARYY